MLFKTSFIAACILLCLSVYSTDLQAQTADSENVKQLKQAQPLFDYSDTTKQATPEKAEKLSNAPIMLLAPSQDAKKEDHSELKDASAIEKKPIPSKAQGNTPEKLKK